MLYGCVGCLGLCKDYEPCFQKGFERAVLVVVVLLVVFASFFVVDLAFVVASFVVHNFFVVVEVVSFERLGCIDVAGVSLDVLFVVKYLRAGRVVVAGEY